MVRCLISTGTT